MEFGRVGKNFSGTRFPFDPVRPAASRAPAFLSWHFPDSEPIQSPGATRPLNTCLVAQTRRITPFFQIRGEIGNLAEHFEFDFI